MTTLVTGAAGFIGGNLVEELLNRGQPVRALVRRESQAAVLRQRGVDVVLGDVLDAGAMESAVKDVKAVLHCAAVGDDDPTKEQIYAINLGGIRSVLEALRKAGRGRLVQISGINVLGNRHHACATEEMPYRRENEPHADVKIDAELLALDYHNRHGVEVTILRPGIAYGPGQGAVARLIDAIRAKKFAFIGSRDNLIPMVSIGDLAQAMLLAAERPIANGRIYHIADGERTSIGQMMDFLAEQVGCEPPKTVLPYFVPAAVCWLFGLLRRLHLYRGAGPVDRVALRFLGTSRFMDISRAKDELGYEPKVSFREGMAATVRWVEKQADDQSNVAQSSA